MRRISALLLEVSLLLSAVVAVLQVVRIGAAIVLRSDRFWGGALATAVTPLLFAAALSLLARTAPASDTKYA